MDYREWHSFREIDRHLGLPKGSAFRCFKNLRHELEEGRDFRLLDASEDGQTIGQLRQQGRIYAASINVVLLSGLARTRIEARLTADPDTGNHS